MSLSQTLYGRSAPILTPVLCVCTACLCVFGHIELVFWCIAARLSLNMAGSVPNSPCGICANSFLVTLDHMLPACFLTLISDLPTLSAHYTHLVCLTLLTCSTSTHHLHPSLSCVFAKLSSGFPVSLKYICSDLTGPLTTDSQPASSRI